jgi:D-arabinose 1-dehydrogenase-like Zn-dependent alcohol dehydrogenase
MGLFGRAFCGVTRLRRPVLGTELTGIVAAIGSAVTRFAPGDAVIVFPGAAVGGHAEYCRFSETGMIVPRPAGLPIETAAALGFGGTTAPVSRGRWARRLVMPVHYAPAAGCLSAARCMARNGPKCSWSGRDGLRARP